MNPVKASLHFPQVTLLLTAAVFCAGIYALLTMPRREDPKITIRAGLVIAMYPGATPEQVEKQLTQKIEERLFRFEEVRKGKTWSTSRNGLCVVNVELEDHIKQPDLFWSKLRHAMIELKMTALPEGVQGPMVKDDYGDTVAVLLALHGGNFEYRQLKEYAQRIEDEFRTSRAVAKLARIGGAEGRDPHYQFHGARGAVCLVSSARDPGPARPQRGAIRRQFEDLRRRRGSAAALRLVPDRGGDPPRDDRYVAHGSAHLPGRSGARGEGRRRGDHALPVQRRARAAGVRGDAGGQQHCRLRQGAADQARPRAHQPAAGAEGGHHRRPAGRGGRAHQPLHPRVWHRHRLRNSGDHAAAAVPRGAHRLAGDPGHRGGDVRRDEYDARGAAPGLDRRLDCGAGHGGG